VVENGPEVAQNEKARGRPLEPFCKQCVKMALNMRQTPLQTQCTNPSRSNPAKTKRFSS